MSGVLIHSTDRTNYINIMNECCGGPHIKEDLGDTLLVDFCASAIEVWVEVGYWYSFQ